MFVVPFASLYIKLDNGNIEISGIEVYKADFDIIFQSKDDIIAKFSQVASCGISLDLNLTPDLIEEGIIRDIIRLIQQERKLNNLNISDRVNIVLYSQSNNIISSIKKFQDLIYNQCLINNIDFSDIIIENAKEYEVNDIKISFLIK